VCARVGHWQRVAQGTGHSLTANAGDGRAHDFPSSIRFPCTSAPAFIDYTSPSHTPTPAPGPPHRPHPLLHSHHHFHSHSRSHSRSHSAFCVRRSPRVPSPPPRARPACAPPPALLFLLSRRDGPSLASAPATLPRDPHHSSLLASRSSHLALPLHSNRLDSPQLASPRHPSLCPVPPAA
jgi:hypothetical protein